MLYRLLLHFLCRPVTPHLGATIGNMEALINTANQEDQHSDQINSKIKDIETCLGVVPW